ncbi:MAG: TraR/DksA family transcriptional regulator [Patescibacteria group bacterium]
MDKSFIAEMNQILVKTKAKLGAELVQFGQPQTRSGHELEASFPDYGDKDDENAAEIATFSDNLALKHTLEKALDDVVKALARIGSGTYGVCKYCGQEIDVRRLRARPESSSCVACKIKQLHKK